MGTQGGRQADRQAGSKFWLDNDFYPSWNSLAVALDKCGYRLMADKIRQPGK